MTPKNDTNFEYARDIGGVDWQNKIDNFVPTCSPRKFYHSFPHTASLTHILFDYESLHFSHSCEIWPSYPISVDLSVFAQSLVSK